MCWWDYDRQQRQQQQCMSAIVGQRHAHERLHSAHDKVHQIACTVYTVTLRQTHNSKKMPNKYTAADTTKLHRKKKKRGLQVVSNDKM